MFGHGISTGRRSNRVTRLGCNRAWVRRVVRSVSRRWVGGGGAWGGKVDGAWGVGWTLRDIWEAKKYIMQVSGFSCSRDWKDGRTEGALPSLASGVGGEVEDGPVSSLSMTRVLSKSMVSSPHRQTEAREVAGRIEVGCRHRLGIEGTRCSVPKHWDETLKAQAVAEG